MKSLINFASAQNGILMQMLEKCSVLLLVDQSAAFDMADRSILLSGFQQ